MCFATLAASVCLASNKSSAVYPGKVPIIFIHGQGAPLVRDKEDGTTENVNFDIDTDKIISTVSENYDVLLKAFATQDWTDFDNMLIDIMTDIYSDCVLDETGEPKDGSRCYFEPTVDWCRERLNNCSDVEAFCFDYDWRLDPLENMDELDAYINMVLEATGSDEYALCGRCEGACLLLQYLEYYKDNHDGNFDDRITDIIFYASAVNGVSPLSEAFAGKLCVDADGIERFVYDTEFNLNYQLTDELTITDELLRKVITVITDYYGTDIAAFAIENVYNQIYTALVPELLINSYSSFPGYWTMVRDEDYEDAKKFIFGSDEKYSAFIEKIDNYHYNIANKSEEIIKEAQENGIEVSDIVKYGKQLYPCTANSDTQSDSLCIVTDASWGATVTNIGETFSDKYINTMAKKGRGSYISPDKCIDAFTGLLPDTTWYIKNIAHKDFPNGVDSLIFEIVNTDNMTVRSNENFPQYLFYDNEKNEISPYKVETQKTNLDNYCEEVLPSVQKEIKPKFNWLYKLITFIIKILTPKAKS